MPNRGPRVNPAIVGLIGAAVMFTLLFFAFTNVALFASTMDMKAQVTTGDTLAPGADVEIAGVKIGTVKSIDKGDPGALIDMSIDTKKASIHKDASIQIRPHGVFGPKFVEIDPGTTSADAFASGDSIPLSRTRISVDFEQVLNTLDTNTRTSLQSFFLEFGTASDGRGADFGQFLDALNTVESQLVPVLQVIDNRSANVGRLFESNAVVSETYANSPFDQILKKNADAFAKLDAASPSISGVIDHGNSLLTSLDTITAGGNTQALATTIAKLPALFDNLQRFNNDLGYGVNALAPEVTPQHGQVDSDVGLALKRSIDAFGQCDITDQTNPNDPRGLADTRHTNFVKIVPCYGPDGKPTRDAAGHVAHHHVDVVLGLHNHPIDPAVENVIPASIVPTLNYPQVFQDALLGDNEGAVLCGPNSDNSTRGSNPAFTCLKTAQSNPIPGHGTPPPPLFGSSSGVSAAGTSAAGAPGSSVIPGLPNTSGGPDVLVVLVLVVGGLAVGFGLWRTRRA
jgi:phospholipid/cholesterol/gamma-HCH transport system substrate-binding protein